MLELKKLTAVISALILVIINLSAYGAYKLNDSEDEHVEQQPYFMPTSTFDDVEAKTISFKDSSSVTFYSGRENEPYLIEADVYPVNATDKALSFKSEDISIAEVDSRGVVTPGSKTGVTYIEVTSGSAKSRFKVNHVIGVEGVAMSQSEMTLYADKPITAQLNALVAPTNATIQEVTWYSDDESIATVDSEGLVYPCGVGSTDIYARTVDGGYTAKCTVTVTTWEKRTEEIPVVYTDYDITVEEMAQLQMEASPTVFTTGVFPAAIEQVEQYVNPENLVTGYDKYQFMDLSSSNNIDASVLDTYLNGKGSLSGLGETFKNAADTNGISEVYLVIHACLETGNGSSELANGVEINGTTVYNMFGIGAVDIDPINAGAKYAYEQGWTTPEKAVEGGAEWISENYINNPSYSQNTLYKMRWNPEEPAQHQYATDVAWASKQAKSMSSMFEAFPTAEYHFEIPTYAGQERFEVK